MQRSASELLTEFSVASPSTAPRVRPASAEPGSFRDRNGKVFYQDGEILRGISAKALADWELLSAAPFFEEWVGRGGIVRTERLADTEVAGDWAAVLHHEAVPFVSYPYEWTFGMLKDAALLHLDLLLAALPAGLILKDSSAYNVQWMGAQPIFIDIPSFEKLSQGEPWVGYRQFCELFLYPLFLQAYKGVDYRPWLRGQIDGIPASGVRALMSARDLVRPGVLLHVLAQDSLQRRYAAKPQNVRSRIAKAGFDKQLIVNNVRGLRKIVAGLTPGGSKTVWADYDQTHSYDRAEFEAKCAFVRNAAQHRHWKRAWDLGCNTGTFSRIVAEHADQVVSMDGDWMAIEHLYQAQKSREDRAKILPLVINLSDPSPAQGWRGTERRSLPERGKPELTLCLALIHHIVISANIPMRDFVGWLAGLGTSLVVEFVSREDEMVQTLLANKDDQYGDYDQANFEACLTEHYQIRTRRPLKGGKRCIYFCTPANG